LLLRIAIGSRIFVTSQQKWGNFRICAGNVKVENERAPR
jgi:hypothetical protein